MTPVERFAPSPTGPLHLGHAFSALTAYRHANRTGGRFLLRIEDLDQERSKAHWETQIYQDLEWLGLTWDHPVLRQSERSAAYRDALQGLWDQGLLYSCHCTRRDIAAASAPQEGAPLLGPDGLVYPGTCKAADHFGSANKDLPDDSVLRLDMAKATEVTGELTYLEVGGKLPETLSVVPQTMTTEVGDVVVARRGMGAAYHLAVVLDDAYQGITHVTRGADLASATTIHVVLQTLLGLPTPTYRHHRLIRDENGKRLAKRDDARAIASYREGGMTPADVLALVGL